MQTLDKIKNLTTNDNGFVFDPFTGSSFSTNPTGLFILKCLGEGMTRPQILGQLRLEFEVGHQDLYSDLDEFVALLRDHNLAPRDFRLDEES